MQVLLLLGTDKAERREARGAISSFDVNKIRPRLGVKWRLLVARLRLINDESEDNERSILTINLRSTLLVSSQFSSPSVMRSRPTKRDPSYSDYLALGHR